MKKMTIFGLMLVIMLIICGSIFAITVNLPQSQTNYPKTNLGIANFTVQLAVAVYPYRVSDSEPITDHGLVEIRAINDNSLVQSKKTGMDSKAIFTLRYGTYKLFTYYVKGGVIEKNFGGGFIYIVIPRDTVSYQVLGYHPK